MMPMGWARILLSLALVLDLAAPAVLVVYALWHFVWHPKYPPGPWDL